jgi:hypothetical protein
MRISLRHGRISLTLAIAVCLLTLIATNPAAQQPRSPQMPTPPPMRFVSRDERLQLTAARDAKERLRISLELVLGRLARVEEFTAHRKFDQASEELGGYLGLIQDLRIFCGGMIRDKGSTRDLYRKLEIALRAQIPRLAVVRRSTPAAYSTHVKGAEEFARETRSEALDSFYGHSVLREGAAEKKPEPNKDAPAEIKRP